MCFGGFEIIVFQSYIQTLSTCFMIYQICIQKEKDNKTRTGKFKITCNIKPYTISITVLNIHVYDC